MMMPAKAVTVGRGGNVLSCPSKLGRSAVPRLAGLCCAPRRCLLSAQRTGQCYAVAQSTTASSVATAQRSIHTNKAVKPVSSEDRDLVHTLMHLSSLANGVDKITAAQMAEHRLTLVTTSATCDSLLANPFSEATDVDAATGDGMAPPAALVRANAEALATAVGGGLAGAGAGAGAGGGGDAGWAAPPAVGGGIRSLEQLTAQADHDALQAARGGGNALAHVRALQQQVSRAAAAAVKAGAPLASATSRAASQTLHSAMAAGQRAPAMAARASSPAPGGAPAQAAPAAAAAQAHPTAAWASMATEDEGAQEGPAPSVLASAAAAAARETGARSNAAAVAAGRAASAAAQSVAASLRAAGSAAAAAGGASHVVYRDPASKWLVVDSRDSGTRHLVISAPPALDARFGRTAERQRLAANADLVTFEAYSLGAKVNRQVYAEALALYNRFLPLVLDYLEDHPAGRVCLSGAGLGGSLASLLVLMMSHRGLRHSALAPAVALNAPPVLVEVPDFASWCGKGGCSLEDVGAMVDDAVARGVLAELGLPPAAVMNVYYNPLAPDGRGAADAAAAAASVSLTGAGARGAPRPGGAADVAGALSRLDGAVLRRVEGSALVPEALKAWLRAGAVGAGAGAAAAGGGGRPLQILYPIGRILWYEPPKTGMGRPLGAHA